ncbi:MAG: PASTA domain-containing protein [Anaerotruncus sp.]|nr:PASTA domain-containing protein [Anaerotruncus sp.]
MAGNEFKLCMGCMSPLFDGSVCSVCGYDANTPSDPSFLPPQTLLVQRYLVGRRLSDDPEGVWYVGFDCKDQQRIWVREYAPANISRRDPESGDVLPLLSAEAQFKALLSDFEDLCSSIQRLSFSERVLPVLDLVHANHTAYAIYRYLKTISLESFLYRSDGRLSWRHTKKLLMPLYHTVANIHKLGLIHRGISPGTVQLDQTGTLWLTNFTIAAARTNKSELSAQLFPGYSAPEQYAPDGWQGTWTDVYALGALTYHVVTGKHPPAAMDRVYGDDLLDRRAVNAEMPATVVQAINQALAFEVSERTKTAEAFISALLVSEGGNTAVYTAPTNRRHLVEEGEPVVPPEPAPPTPPQPQDTSKQAQEMEMVPMAREERPAPHRREPPKRRRRKQKKGHPVLSLFLSLLVATALLGGGVYWVATNYLEDLLQPQKSSSSASVSSSEPDSSTSEDQLPEDGTVPRLVSRPAADVKTNYQLNRNYNLIFEEKFNSDYAEGIIFDQLPIEGSELEKGGDLTLFVSKGPEIIDMPSIIGSPTEDAIELLNGLGIKFDLIPVHNNSYEPNVIVRSDKQPGDKIDVQRDTIMLYIKDVGEEDEEEEEDEPSSSSRRSSSSSRPYRVSSSSSKSNSGRVTQDRHGNIVVEFDDED